MFSCKAEEQESVKEEQKVISLCSFIPLQQMLLVFSHVTFKEVKWFLKELKHTVVWSVPVYTVSFFLFCLFFTDKAADKNYD